MTIFPSVDAVEALFDRFELGRASLIIEEICGPEPSSAQDLAHATWSNSTDPLTKSSQGKTPNSPAIAPGAGFKIHVRPMADIYPASMIKVPLAVAAADALAKGRLFDAPLRVRAEHMTVNDAPSPLQIGYEAGVFELVELMLRFSDNVATNVLLDAVGRESGSNALLDYGLSATRLARYLSGSLPRLRDAHNLGENAHPAGDSYRLFCGLAAGAIPHANRLLEYLGRQHWVGKLASGLLPGDVLAHKTGDTSDVSHDGGLLRCADGRRFVIVLYTQCPSSDDTDARIAAWTREIRRLLEDHATT